MPGTDATTADGVYQGIARGAMSDSDPRARGILKRWTIARPGLGIDAPPLFDRVLAARGLTDPAAAAVFLEPKLTSLHEPALMIGMDRAAERLLRALRDGEPIAIYGDYDVDGVSATAVLVRTLRHLNPHADVRTYVPHRLDEGYGLNAPAIRQLAEDGAKVIVSVDCGITAVGPAAVARELAVDLIITDHHNPPETTAALPDAYAVVHPRHPGSRYPFGELCGAGVAYKLAWRLAALAAGGGGRVDQKTRELLVNLLAFVALGSIADVVPLVDENRVIAAFGLTRVRRSPFVGLRALAAAARLTGDKVSEWDVGFRLAPRLNACGRMGHAKEAVELFLTEDPARAAAIAEALERANNERRAVEQRIVEQAEAMARDAGMHRSDRRAIVLAHESWHAGVVGICCSRLVERFGRPVILMQLDPCEGTCHGSGRSIDGFNLHAALEACAGHLTRFGGHDMAAGVHLDHANLPAFTDAFIDHATRRIPESHLTPVVRADAEATVGEVDLSTIKRLDALRPFGRGNPGVRIVIRNARIDQSPRPFGTGAAHLELVVTDAVSMKRLKLTGWRWAEHRERLTRGMTIDAVVTPTLDTWGGEKPAGELMDIRLV